MAMWPPFSSSPLYSAKVSALIAGPLTRMVISDQPPRLTQHLFAPALEKYSIKPQRGWGGGVGGGQSKHRTQGRIDEPSQWGPMIQLDPLTPKTFDLFNLLKLF